MSLAAEIEAVVLPVLRRHGCDLVEGTFRREQNGLVLRLLIERRGDSGETGSGVDVALCSSVSRDVGAALDAGDLIAKAYTLEVSSPGIERPLIRDEDFTRFRGKPVALKTREAISGRRRFTGILGGLQDGVVTINTGDGHTVAIPHAMIARANLVFDEERFKTNRGDR